MTNGFFVEAGADDFETGSNTLHFEVNKNWKGLLVEPNPIIYPAGLVKNRKVWFSPNCLATKASPQFVSFSSESVIEGGMAGIVDDDNDNISSYTMQCLPLYTLLLAVGATTVNYFSLDIEGPEFQV